MDLALSPPDCRLMSPLTPSSPSLDAAIVPEITGDGTMMLLAGGVGKRRAVDGNDAAFVDATALESAYAPATHTLHTPQAQLLETPFDFGQYATDDATPPPAEQTPDADDDVLAEYFVTEPADAETTAVADVCSHTSNALQSHAALTGNDVTWLESAVDLDIGTASFPTDALLDHNYALPTIDSDDQQGINAIVAEIRETAQELELSTSPELEMTDLTASTADDSTSSTPSSQMSLDAYIADYASRYHSDIALVVDDDAADLDARSLPVYEYDEEAEETPAKRKYSKRLGRPLTQEERRARKKQQNVEAARRYRLKKNAEKFGASQMLHDLKQRNLRLRATVKTTEAEIAIMKNLLHDVRSRLPL